MLVALFLSVLLAVYGAAIRAQNGPQSLGTAAAATSYTSTRRQLPGGVMAGFQRLAVNASHSLPNLAVVGSRPAMHAPPQPPLLESVTSSGVAATDDALVQQGRQKRGSLATVLPWDAAPDPDTHPYLVRHHGRSSTGAGIQERANAVIFILARNNEAGALVHTLQDFESNFNGQYAYPYLFINDDLFDDNFIGAMQGLRSAANMTFGKVRQLLA